MALSITTNSAALQAAAAASSFNRNMETSMERLSTGKRINSASDDAAGVAIASRLTAEIRGTNQAIRNALDGRALIDTAEGGHKEIESILQRMRELSLQALNDTNSNSDRDNMQQEVDALSQEIDRIASGTTWAGQSLVSGTNTSFSLQVGSATGDKNQIVTSVGSMSKETLFSVNGPGGFTINGIAENDGYSGLSVSGGGDINGDSFADVIVGAGAADSSTGTLNVGSTHVIFGKKDGTTVELSSIASDNEAGGFVINGVD